MHKCKECGYIHPAISGACPAAKAKTMESSIKGKAIIKFINTLMDFLQNSDHWENQIRLIENTLKLG